MQLSYESADGMLEYHVTYIAPCGSGDNKSYCLVIVKRWQVDTREFKNVTTTTYHGFDAKLEYKSHIESITAPLKCRMHNYNCI